jgi:hypothetical protein
MKNGKLRGEGKEKIKNDNYYIEKTTHYKLHTTH